MSQLFEENLTIIAETLIQRGFKLKRSKKAVFEGEVCCGTHCFRVRFSDIDPSFLRLPVVTLLSAPQGLTPHLPHIEESKELCYLDREGVFIDPFSPERATETVIASVQQLLEGLLDHTTIAKEFASEFRFYWQGQAMLYLLAHSGKAVSKVFVSKTVEGKTKLEHVVAADNDSLEYWAKGRYEVPAEKPHPPGRAIVLRMAPPPILDPQCWPPADWPSFIEWLKKYHSSVKTRLFQLLPDQLKVAWSVTVVIHSQESGPFAVWVQFKPEFEETLKRYRGQKRAKRGHLEKLLSGKQFVSKFERLNVQDMTEGFVYQRNFPGGSLENRRIAIIGCGTVGGFAANLLVKAGVGTGNKGKLDLFDGQMFTTSNLGRHILGTRYLLEEKGISLAEEMRGIAVHQANIQGFGNMTVAGMKRLSDYDLVIDTTGNETFSVSLSHHAHQERAKQIDFPTIIHGWIEGGGMAVRALADDGIHACYRCLKIPKQGGSGELVDRYPVFTQSSQSDPSQMVHSRCGESFFPFSSSVSSHAAAIIHEMVVDSFTGLRSPRFRHLSLGSGVRETKNQNPSRHASCPNCS